MKIAILDDYQSIALTMADWTPLLSDSEITVFSSTISDQVALIKRLSPFDALCVMRERTPLNADVLRSLPNLKFIASTGPRNASIDSVAAGELGIEIGHTGYFSEPAVEMTWAIIHALCRHIVKESVGVKTGHWQQTLGTDLYGRTLGLLGLGNIGAAVAKVATAFGMETIAWSQNLTPEMAKSKGATYVSKEMLFKRSDVLSVHTILSDRTRGMVDAEMLALMKSSAFLINTSRGAIVSEQALIGALEARAIAGAGLDVFDVEPLPIDHPYRLLDNVVATPHLGYVSDRLYRQFYTDTVKNLSAWLERWSSDVAS